MQVITFFGFVTLVIGTHAFALEKQILKESEEGSHREGRSDFFQPGGMLENIVKGVQGLEGYNQMRGNNPGLMGQSGGIPQYGMNGMSPQLGQGQIPSGGLNQYPQQQSGSLQNIGGNQYPLQSGLNQYPQQQSGLLQNAGGNQYPLQSGLNQYPQSSGSLQNNPNQYPLSSGSLQNGQNQVPLSSGSVNNPMVNQYQNNGQIPASV